MAELTVRRIKEYIKRPLLFVAYLFSIHSLCYSQTPVNNHNGLTAPAFLFTNVNLISIEDGRVLHNMDVLVKGAVIADVRKHRKRIPKKEKDLWVIPSQGKYIMPGLVDCHTHILFKDELVSYLENGVTTVFSLGGPANVLELKEQVRQGKLDGPGIYAGALVDAMSIDWEGIVFGKSVKSVKDVDSVMNQIKSERWDFIKVYNSLTTGEFDAIMTIAKLNGLPVVGHGVREPGMEHILAKGMSLVAHSEEYLYTLFKDSLDERKIPEAVALTKKYGAYVCPNLSTFKTISEQWGDSLSFARLLNEPGDLKYGLNPFILHSWVNNNRYINKKGSILSAYLFLKKLTYAMYKEGIPLVAGTDSPIIPACYPGYSLVKDLQALAETGITNADALKSATLVPGQFIRENLNNPPNLGLIRKGYQSDLLLLSENPLQNLQNLRSIEGVMVKGKWYPRSALEKLEKPNRTNQ